MIDANEIKQAIELLDAKDDTQWEADGTPKLDVLKSLTNKPELTLDDVDEAVGAFKRGQKVKVAKPVSDGTKKAEAATPTVDLSKLDPNSPEYAEAVVTAARTEDARLQAQVIEAEATRDAANATIKKLNALRDKQIVTIEHYAPKISQAQAVKMIQKQTIAGLAATKNRMTAATQMLTSGGVVQVFPSKLDAELAMRKRTQEQTSNMAKYIHQQAAERANRPPV